MPVIRKLVSRGESFVTILAGETSLSVHGQVMRPHIHFQFITLWTSAFLSFQTQKIEVLIKKTFVIILDKKGITFDPRFLYFKSSVTHCIWFGYI